MHTEIIFINSNKIVSGILLKWGPNCFSWLQFLWLASDWSTLITWPRYWLLIGNKPLLASWAFHVNEGSNCFNQSEARKSLFLANKKAQIGIHCILESVLGMSINNFYWCLPLCVLDAGTHYCCAQTVANQRPVLWSRDLSRPIRGQCCSCTDLLAQKDVIHQSLGRVTGPSSD